MGDGRTVTCFQYQSLGSLCNAVLWPCVTSKQMMWLTQRPPCLEFICGWRWKSVLLYFTHLLLSVRVKLAKIGFFSGVFVLSTPVQYLNTFQAPSIETRTAVSPAVLLEQESSWVLVVHVRDASSNSSWALEMCLKRFWSIEVKLNSSVFHFSKAVVLLQTRPGFCRYKLLSKKPTCRSLRVNETVPLCSLFPLLSEISCCYSVFISTALCFAAALCV